MNDEAYDRSTMTQLIIKLKERVDSALPTGVARLAVTAVHLDPQLKVANAATEWEHVESFDKMDERFTRENIARMISGHALEVEKKTFSEKEFLDLSIAERVKRLASRELQLVDEQVEGEVGFIFLVTAFDSPETPDLHLLGFGVGEQGLIDTHYTDGCCAAIRHVLTEPENKA